MQKSFMEVQFPVSKVSKESYKERKAVQGQTLTGLGKWWGRKPLILVRATILGLLLPATDNPAKDREIFLKILGMDDTGLWARKYKSIAIKTLYDYTSPQDRLRYFMGSDKPVWKPGLTKEDKDSLQRSVFVRMGYDEKITYCKRPEEMENIPTESWADINAHLGTTARTLQELMQQLSEQRYGKVITVGDCFAGGGSIPFEAARIGLSAYGSDLNPVAGLLTWASMMMGTNDDEVKKLNKFRDRVYAAVDQFMIDNQLETNENGDRANCYLYCNEADCPSCGWKVPLSTSWVVGVGSMTIATLVPNSITRSYDIEITMGVSKSELKSARATATITEGGMKCPNCGVATPISSIRKDRRVNGEAVSGLREWDRGDFVPRRDDVFQERLYCIRYETQSAGRSGRYYVAPTKDDLKREDKIIKLLGERFSEWQDKGYIPSDTIELGDETTRLIRERGWRYWHQLFNPRHLLLYGLFIEFAVVYGGDDKSMALTMLGINRMTNWSSKLCMWGAGQARESIAQTFYNQALNTTFNYPARALSFCKEQWNFTIEGRQVVGDGIVEVVDAREMQANAELWITDPPYADAVNYHELSEFFLAWDKKLIENTFPEWYAHSNRAHAVKGTGSSFAHAMIDVYRNLSDHMPDDGMQVVMFTHQDPAVWAELSLILWAAKLQVTAAWNIATETDSGGLKTGNYVKGTVLMALRKNLSTNKGWLDDAYPQIKLEVKNQIDNMRDLDNASDPDFTDNDYILAAYAASLKILTSYSELGDVNIEYELSRELKKGEKSKVTEVIESAKRIAYEYLVPRGISKNLWRDLSAHEKFYIEALSFERSGDTSVGSQIELARSFGVSDYSLLQASGKANHARVKTPMEFTNKLVGVSHPFSTSLTRHVLMAIYLAAKNEDSNAGRNWLKNELPNYWQVRDKIGELLGFIMSLSSVADTDHWQESVQYAGYVKSLVENDGV